MKADTHELRQLEQVTARAASACAGLAPLDRLPAPRMATGKLAFLPRFLVQASLPYRRPVDRDRSSRQQPVVELHRWSRSNGATTFTLQCGQSSLTGTAQQPVGLPYGAYPRLILSFLATEVARTDRPLIQLGRNVSEFLARLDIQVTGGKTGALTALRDQMRRLLATTIRVEACGAAVIADGPWWRAPAMDAPVSWHPLLELSEPFYRLLRDSSVALDARVFRRLARSPIAMDVFALASAQLQERQPPKSLSWKALEAHMGGGSSSAKFVENFKRAVSQVREACPQVALVARRDHLVCSTAGALRLAASHEPPSDRTVERPEDKPSESICGKVKCSARPMAPGASPMR